MIVMDKYSAYFPSASPSHCSLLATWGSWDNAMMLTSSNDDLPPLSLHPHPLDRVSCCECVCNGQVLVSGGTAGSLSFWHISNTQQELSSAGRVTILRGHDGPVTCMAACRPYSIVVTGSMDKTCIIWDTNRICFVNSLGTHESAIGIIATSPTLGDIATVCSNTLQAQQSRFPPSILRVWTINGRLVGKLTLHQQLNCLCYSSAPEGVYVNVIIGGLADGSIHMWSSWDLSFIFSIPCPFKSPSPAVLSLCISSCSRELYAGYSSQKLLAWVKLKQEACPDDLEYIVLTSRETSSNARGLDTYYTLHKHIYI